MEFYSHRLGNMNFEGSQLSNFQLNTYLEQDNRPLPLGEQDVAVNEYEQFIKERNKSTCFRISGILRGIFSNVLFNVTGDKSYENVLALTGRTGDFNPNIKIFQNFGYKDILLERDGWFFYRENTSGTLRGCVDTFLRPVPNDFYFTPSPLSALTMFDSNGNPRNNWFFKLTYPKYTACTSIFFQSPYIPAPDPFGRVYLCDGIVVNIISGGTLNGRVATYIETPIKHGLLNGDRIILRPVTNLVLEQVFNVLNIESDYGFWIDFYDDDIPTNVITNSVLTNNPLRFKRIVQGIESKYLVRTFVAITDLNDYQIYKAAFSNTIYNDPIQLYHYQLDIDTSKYRDYLNRPLTELYLTKIKYTNPNGFVQDMEPWTNLSVGLLLNRSNRCNNYSVTTIYGGTPTNPLPSPPAIIEVIDENTTTFFGDIIDYNMGNLTERVLEVPYYRFNTVNREDNFYSEGYYYKAHDKIQLLEFASQVEIENISLPDEGIPDYAVNINGVLQWRDLLTPGFVDSAGVGVDYPFLNGCTYIFNEHELCLYRQNPKQLEPCCSSTGLTISNGNNVSTSEFSVEAAIGTSYYGLITDLNPYYNNMQPIDFANVIVSNPNLSQNGSSYTIPNDGSFIFTYDFDISVLVGVNSTPDPNTGIIQTNPGCSILDFSFVVRHYRGTNLIQEYFIYNAQTDVFTNYIFNGVVTINNALTNDTIVIMIDTAYQFVTTQYPCFYGADFSVEINSGKWCLGYPCPIPGSSTTFSACTYNYWLAGINCNNVFGEYLEPIDGDC